MAVLFAVPRTRRLVPLLATLVRVVAGMAPVRTLDLEPRLYFTGVEIDIRPAQAERFALADAKRKRDRPAGAVAPVGGGVEDLPCLLLGECLDLGMFGVGASTSVATFRLTLSRRTAMVSARDRMR
jgi:hypothetical protein